MARISATITWPAFQDDQRGMEQQDDVLNFSQAISAAVSSVIPDIVKLVTDKAREAFGGLGSQSPSLQKEQEDVQVVTETVEAHLASMNRKSCVYEDDDNDLNYLFTLTEKYLQKIEKHEFLDLIVVLRRGAKQQSQAP